MVNIFLKLFRYDSIIIFINSNHKKEQAISHLLNMVDKTRKFLNFFLSNKTIFQKFILKKYNAKNYDIDSLKLLHTSNDLKSKILYKNIYYDNSIFNKNKLCQKLIRFLNF